MNETMSSEKLDLIENVLKSKKIEEYEIFLVNRAIVETMFLKDKIENEREIEYFEYFIRTLTQKEDQTGIGVVKGNSLDHPKSKRMLIQAFVYQKIIQVLNIISQLMLKFLQ